MHMYMHEDDLDLAGGSRPARHEPHPDHREDGARPCGARSADRKRGSAAPRAARWLRSGGSSRSAKASQHEIVAPTLAGGSRDPRRYLGLDRSLPSRLPLSGGDPDPRRGAVPRCRRRGTGLRADAAARDDARPPSRPAARGNGSRGRGARHDRASSPPRCRSWLGRCSSPGLGSVERMPALDARQAPRSSGAPARRGPSPLRPAGRRHLAPSRSPAQRAVSSPSLPVARLLAQPALR